MFQGCNNLRLRELAVTHELCLVLICLHCPEVVPFRKFCHINVTLIHLRNEANLQEFPQDKH